MRIILLSLLLFYSIDVFAGTSQCKNPNDRQYVLTGYNISGGYPLYEVYCSTYPNPSYYSSSTSGPGGGVSVPTIDFTLVKKLPFSIFNIKL